MKATLFIILSVCFFTAITSGQKKLTKEEIIKDWTAQKTNASKDKDAFEIAELDTVLYTNTRKLIDSLHRLDIDTVIVYTIAYLGLNGVSNCLTGSSPMTSFVTWKHLGETYVHRSEGRCNMGFSKINSTLIFDYYNKHLATIENEYFMPVIFGAVASNSNRVRYSMSIVNHEPNYAIIYKAGKDFKAITFSESELENKRSLFHNHNLNLRSYTWWKIIQKELQ